MDRDLIRQHLTQAEKRVRTGAGNIATQRVIIARLQAMGADATVARQILDTFKELQATHIGDRDRLAAQLAKS